MKRVLSIGSLWTCALLAGAVSAAEVTDLTAPHVSAQITLQQVQRAGSVEKAKDGVAQQRYAFQPAAQPQIVIAPAHGMWDWSGQGELHVRVQNAMPWAVTLTIDIDGADASQHLHADVGLPAGPAQMLVLPLHATSPRAFGMQVGPPMPFDDHGRTTLLVTTVEGTLDLHKVRAIRLGMPAPQAAQTLLLVQVEATAGGSTHADSGQRRSIPTQR